MAFDNVWRLMKSDRPQMCVYEYGVVLWSLMAFANPRKAMKNYRKNRQIWKINNTIKLFLISINGNQITIKLPPNTR